MHRVKSSEKQHHLNHDGGPGRFEINLIIQIGWGPGDIDLLHQQVKTSGVYIWKQCETLLGKVVDGEDVL